MKVSKRHDAFARMTDERYERDIDIASEAVEWDRNNEICHAECVEEEDRDE